MIYDVHPESPGYTEYIYINIYATCEQGPLRTLIKLCSIYPASCTRLDNSHYKVVQSGK